MPNWSCCVAVLQHQVGIGVTDFRSPPAQYNPLDEPSPLGLSLRKSPSLLDLIQMRLSQGKMSKAGNPGKKEQKGNSSTTEKLKASNFPASILKIGSWEVFQFCSLNIFKQGTFVVWVMSGGCNVYAV